MIGVGFEPKRYPCRQELLFHDPSEHLANRLRGPAPAGYPTQGFAKPGDSCPSFPISMGRNPVEKWEHGKKDGKRDGGEISNASAEYGVAHRIRIFCAGR